MPRYLHADAARQLPAAAARQGVKFQFDWVAEPHRIAAVVFDNNAVDAERAVLPALANEI
jgi:hypothetical protein